MGSFFAYVALITALLSLGATLNDEDEINLVCLALTLVFILSASVCYSLGL